MRKKKQFRVLFITIASLTLVALGAFGLAAVGNSFRFTKTEVSIPTRSGNLVGVLASPSGDTELQGLVVMVHGDGPVEATQGGLYDPWFEGAADAGFATLSWSKPGVGGSDGNWLEQSMDDRAAEVGAAIDWAKTQSDIPTDRIVLWGASQAGWVLPKVVANRTDVSGTVAVGPAINWLSQGRFNLLAELKHEQATAAQRDAAVAESNEVRALLERGASYSEYLAATPEATPMTEERWGFVLRNVRADATADLSAAAARDTPTLLLIGEHDRNVNVNETELVYQDTLESALTVKRIDAVHSMARPIVDENDFVGTAVGVFWPRALLAPGVIDSYTQFLRTLPRG